MLGSRATDLLSGLGPPPVEAGDELPLGRPRPSAGARSTRPRAGPPHRRAPRPARAARGLVRPRLRRGARRVVVRRRQLLQPDRPAPRGRGDPRGRASEELPSEGMVLGAVQVPPNGQPVVFLHDHPTTGGYPVVGVVVPDDLPACAQLRPGEQVTLRVVGPASAAGSSAGRLSTRPGCGLRGLEPHRDHPATGAPDPAAAVLLVDDVHAGCPRASGRWRRRRPPRSAVVVGAARRPGRTSSAASANRSSWIQSASPETPTPSRRTPPEVSSSASSRRATRAI